MNIYSLSMQEISDLFASLNLPSYRAKQLFSGLHACKSVEEISTLPKTLIAKLQENFDCNLPKIERKLVSQMDNTVKYLFALSDGNCVESVVMEYEYGHTICISSQVGCRMGCKFCASTLGGKVRDLEAGELLGQVLMAQRDLNIRISGIVLMGIGEPLDNYDNVIKFLRLVGDKDGINIGYRHISLSTCGLVEKIKQLAQEDLPITLSISLHAPDDETRSSIMPVNKAYGVDLLLDTCKEYFQKTGRRISFEYTLIAGKNDNVEQAEKLANVLNRHLRTRTETMPIHVNLIPVNEVKETGMKTSNRDAVKKFASTLEKKGIRATVRRTLGSDINASCGQLRRAEAKKGENGEGKN